MLGGSFWKQKVEWCVYWGFTVSGLRSLTVEQCGVGGLFDYDSHPREIDVVK